MLNDMETIRGRVCLVLIAGIMTINMPRASADVDSTLLCSASYCSSQTCTDPPENCDAQNETHSGIWMPSQTFCNCCDYCLVYLLKDDVCTLGSLGAAPAGSICGPGLICKQLANEDYSTCQRMSTPCLALQDDYDNRREDGTLGPMEERVECDEDGRFGSKSCIPGQNCYCTAKDGTRIFGEVVNEKSTGSNMRCACSVAAYEAEQLNGPGTSSLRCTADGGYDPLQCIGNRCFCVNPVTGVLSSMVLVDLDTTSLACLPCYDKSIHHNTRSYLRECEEDKEAILEEIQNAEDEGYSYLGSPLPHCQPDGYFGSILVVGQTKFCVDGTKKQIQNFQADLADPSSKEMNCNCARTYNLLAAASSSFLPSCCKNGNWRLIQCRRGACYCVDQNGAQLGMQQEMEDVHLLDCYTNTWTVC